MPHGRWMSMTLSSMTTPTVPLSKLVMPCTPPEQGVEPLMKLPARRIWVPPSNWM